jgi:UDP-2,3-diacylglucosamine hydrolase
MEQNHHHDRHVGLLAAWGRFPVAVAETLKRDGYRVSCLGVKNHADPVLQELCDDFSWMGLTRLGYATRYFRRCGVQQAVMAGKVHKVLFYQPWLWLRHLPDLGFFRMLGPHFVTNKSDRRDDTLLGAIVHGFARCGIDFQPATYFAPELLVKPGLIAGNPLTDRQRADMEFGWTIAKEMGRFDIGQCICVRDRTVIAVEAIEGTDECIRRAGQLCRNGGFTVIKVAKPQQDLRFDMPTIGVGTLETMRAAGAKVLAVEGDMTILLDEQLFRDFASRHKLVVVAMPRAASAVAAA